MAAALTVTNAVTGEPMQINAAAPSVAVMAGEAATMAPRVAPVIHAVLPATTRASAVPRSIASAVVVVSTARVRATPGPILEAPEIEADRVLEFAILQARAREVIPRPHTGDATPADGVIVAATARRATGSPGQVPVETRVLCSGPPGVTLAGPDAPVAAPVHGATDIATLRRGRRRRMWVTVAVIGAQEATVGPTRSLLPKAVSLHHRVPPEIGGQGVAAVTVREGRLGVRERVGDEAGPPCPRGLPWLRRRPVSPALQDP